MNWIISPTFDWTASKAFPVIEGAFHWVVMDRKWQRLTHGFTDTIEEAFAAVKENL